MLSQSLFDSIFSLSIVLLNEERDCSSPLVEYAHTLQSPHSPSLVFLFPSFPPLSCLLHFTLESRRRRRKGCERGRGEKE